MIQHYFRTVSAMAAIAIAGTVSAAVVDCGEIERGKEYSFSKGDEVRGTYTAPETGMYKFVYRGHEVAVFPNQNYTDPVEHTFFYGADGTRNWMIPIEAGQTVYLYSSPLGTLSDGSLMVAERPETIELESVSPSLNPEDDNYYGGELSAARHYRMTFFFSDQVTCTSASLRFPNGEYSTCATQIVGSSIQVGFSSQIMEAYRNGQLKEGDTAKIRLVGVKCADYPDIRYGTNGRLEVEFTVAGKPLELVNMVNSPTTGMEKMLSYYLPGDPNGIITMEFDGELLSDATHMPYAQITFGNPEDVEHPIYTEMLPVSVDGSALKIDLTGKLRRPVDMIPGLAAESQQTALAIRVGNIFSPDGQNAFTGSMSSFSAFAYAYPIETVSYTFATDYTPARGTHVKQGDKVEIWVMNGQRISFDNVTVTSEKDGEPVQAVIEKENLEITADPDDEEAMLVYFDMPELDLAQDTPLKVTLGNVFFADGVDHSSDVLGNYLWNTGVGIESPVSEAALSEPVDVYTVTGVCVLRDATAADIRNLPAGMYIIGNRKVVVR